MSRKAKQEFFKAYLQMVKNLCKSYPMQNYTSLNTGNVLNWG